jgi:hypothetical protein
VAQAKTQAKTQATNASVGDYIAAQADAQRRSDCEALVQLMTRITQQAPVMWGPSIVGFGSYHYRYDSGREGDSCLLGFSSRKADLTIYATLGFEGAQALLDQLGKHKTAKACLYIKRLSDIHLPALEALLAHALAEMKRRHP